MYSLLLILSQINKSSRHWFSINQVTRFLIGTSAYRGKLLLGLGLLLSYALLPTHGYAQPFTLQQLNERTVGVGTDQPKAFLNVVNKRTVLFGVDSTGGGGRPTVKYIDKYGSDPTGTAPGTVDLNYRPDGALRFLNQPIEPKMIWYGNKGAFRAGGVYTGPDPKPRSPSAPFKVPLSYFSSSPSLVLIENVPNDFGKLIAYDSLSFHRFWDNSEFFKLRQNNAPRALRDVIGDFSFASGANTRASGQFSTAMGYQTQALGHFSTAMGYKSWAISDLSFVVGSYSMAGAPRENNKEFETSGSDQVPDGNFAICIGSGSIATGTNSVVLGNYSYASSPYSVAIGFGSATLRASEVDNNNTFNPANSAPPTFKRPIDDPATQFATAIGFKALAHGQFSMALGQGSRASGKYANTLGYDTRASGEKAIALGSENEAKGVYSTALGNGTLADQQYSTAIGKDAQALAEYSISLGYSSIADAPESMALGRETRASGGQSTALGYRTRTNGRYSTALGNQAVAVGESAVSLGTSTTANGNSSTAMGVRTIAGGTNSTAMGENTRASGSGSMASGTGTEAEGPYSMATGVSTRAIGAAAVSMGGNTIAAGQNAIAAGINTTAGGSNAIAAGIGTIASGNAAVSLGISTTASGAYALAMGLSSRASGQNALAMGLNSVASGPTSVALGNMATASGNVATSIGFNATASGNNSIALGSFVSTNAKTGAFVIGDAVSASTYTSTADNQLIMRFSGGMYLFTGVGPQTSNVGVSLAPFGNAWQSLSDSTRKENFRTTDGKAFLRKISQMRLGSWNYKGQDAKLYRHYGPMAQDFFAAFGHDAVGTIGEDKTINQADFDGVNLIAIKALIQEVEQLKADNQQLKAELESARQQEKNVQARLAKIEALLTEPSANRSVTFKP